MDTWIEVDRKVKDGWARVGWLRAKDPRPFRLTPVDHGLHWRVMMTGILSKGTALTTDLGGGWQSLWVRPSVTGPTEFQFMPWTHVGWAYIPHPPEAKRFKEQLEGRGSDKYNLVVHAPIERITDANYEAMVLQSDDQVMVVFEGPFCPACEKQKLETHNFALYAPHTRTAIVDIDAAPTAAAGANIQAVPTVALFRQGQEVARREQLTPRSEMDRMAIVGA